MQTVFMARPHRPLVPGFDLQPSDLHEAEGRIRPFIHETPLLEFPGEEGLHLKLENLQRTGSFKLRGAINAIEALPAKRVLHGVSTVSAGNHGLGVAWAAHRRGIDARVYVPEKAVARKVDAMRALGAEVVATPGDRLGQILVDQDAGDGAHFISPFANAHVAAGQGTLGVEIERRLPTARTILVPVGGGGLALGVGTAIRHLMPHAKTYGVTAAGSPAVARAWETGKAEPVKPDTIADGLGAPIADLHVVAQLKTRLAGLITVEDTALRNAMRRLAVDAKTVAEPAGAAAVAAALEHPELPRPIVAVVSGGNADPRLLADVLG